MTQQQWTIFPENVIERIKAFYGFRFDAEVHRFLGLTGGALSNWKRRKRVNIDSVVAGCRKPNDKGLYPNVHWVLFGQGPTIAATTEAETVVLDPQMLADLFAKLRDVVAAYDRMAQVKPDYTSR